MYLLIRTLSILVLLSLGLSASSTPRYTPLTLAHMAMGSGLTVHGTIVEVRAATFVLQVDSVIKGELAPAARKSKRMEVARFRNWACASRWTEYKAGQEVLLFLNANGVTGLSPEILSGGGEGEMPVLSVADKDQETSKWVVLRGLEVHDLGTMLQLPEYSKERESSAVELTPLIKELREFHACFHAKDLGPDGSRRQPFQVTQLVPSERVEAFSKRSKVARQLVDGARALMAKPAKK